MLLAALCLCTTPSACQTSKMLYFPAPAVLTWPPRPRIVSSCSSSPPGNWKPSSRSPTTSPSDSPATSSNAPACAARLWTFFAWRRTKLVVRMVRFAQSITLAHPETKTRACLHFTPNGRRPLRPRCMTTRRPWRQRGRCLARRTPAALVGPGPLGCRTPEDDVAAAATGNGAGTMATAMAAETNTTRMVVRRTTTTTTITAIRARVARGKTGTAPLRKRATGRQTAALSGKRRRRTAIVAAAAMRGAARTTIISSTQGGAHRPATTTLPQATRTTTTTARPLIAISHRTPGAATTTATQGGNPLMLHLLLPTTATTSMTTEISTLQPTTAVATMVGAGTGAVGPTMVERVML
mmetsp:Transcript_7178/g.18416  ORF Transcript_7178/g.18416 Transcript_7178/m.18416 type:complete len:353 (+) Transcript_7178:648-1706(+)